MAVGVKERDDDSEGNMKPRVVAAVSYQESTVSLAKTTDQLAIVATPRDGVRHYNILGKLVSQMLETDGERTGGEAEPENKVRTLTLAMTLLIQRSGRLGERPYTVTLTRLMHRADVARRQGDSKLARELLEEAKQLAQTRSGHFTLLEETIGEQTAIQAKADQSLLVEFFGQEGVLEQLIKLSKPILINVMDRRLQLRGVRIEARSPYIQALTRYQALYNKK